MWTAGGWTDYSLLDCTEGTRLERWGGFVLARPDPQVIWHTPKQHPRWQNPDAVYHRSSSGGGHWETNTLPRRWALGWEELRFSVGLMNFKHTGIFPEQAANWSWLREQIGGRPLRVLNLFGYTGAATLACAKAGASVCHVDAAKGMVQMARENAKLSGLEKAPIRWIVDDCQAFAERELRRGSRYDALILDPPSFGRGPTGQVWRLEDDLYRFLMLIEKLLSDTPRFVLLNSYTTGLSPSVLTYLLDAVFKARRGGQTVSGELGLACEATGVSLPCGASGRWTN